MMSKIFDQILKNKALALVLIVFTIFTVSLTENLQIADGFSVSARPMIFDLQVGETGTYKWTVTNSGDEDIYVELYATGPGSELMIFDNYLTIPPHLSVYPEIFVVVPEDHKNNIEYHPELFALKRSAPPPTEGEILEATVSINVQMKSLPIIKIGDKPIYTPPVEEIPNEIPPPPKAAKPEVKVEEEKELTAAEKIAQIQKQNQERDTETPVASSEQSAEKTVGQETDYLPEPIMDEEPVVYDKDNLPETDGTCGIWEWILSLFGMAKC